MEVIKLGIDYVISKREADRYGRNEIYRIAANFLSNDIKITTNLESTNNEKYTFVPSTGWDYFKSLLAPNMQFGWLNPSYKKIAIAIKHEQNTIKHYHVYPLPQDTHRVSWVQPSYGEWCRIAVYGNSSEELFVNIRLAIDILERKNLNPRRLILTIEDSYKLRKSTMLKLIYCGEAGWDEKIGSLFQLEVETTPNTIVSFVEV